MTKTNIKNLPEGKYFTECMYSDSHAWLEINRTAKTVTVVEVMVKPDPEWDAKKEFYPGGFCGHMANQHEQTWLYSGCNYGRERKLRMTKKGWSYKGTRYMEDVAREFHDYNF